MKKISCLLISLIVLGISSSCLKNEICSPYAIELNAVIYTLIENENDGLFDTIPYAINIDSIYAPYIDSVNLLGNEVDIASLNFPLDNANNESSFVLSIDGVKDTVTFSYEKHILFNSVKCGITNTYTITSFHYSTHSLKALVLINPEIDVISKENIQFIF
ncbi:MAG: hypothetical protein JW857_06510 [Bacteroidales bacterium]|nr:hypothetical protein [Bacteroidales bacterium]